MPAYHHQFILFRIARKLGDYVEGIGIGRVELRLDVECQLHRNVVLQQPRHAVIVFRCDGDLRQIRCDLVHGQRCGSSSVGVARRGLRVAAEKRTAFAPRRSLQCQQHAFILPISP